MILRLLFLVIQGPVHVQIVENFELLEAEQSKILPTCFSSHIVNKCSFLSLLSPMFFRVLLFLLEV